MHLHSTVAALVCGGLVLWSRPSASDVEWPQNRSDGYSFSPEAIVDDFPCLRAMTCSAQRIRNVPTCPGMKVVETRRIDYSRATNPDARPECTRQDHWLVRGDGSPPVLLVTDCFLQDRPRPPGASATAIVGCDIFFRYFEDGDSTSRIRDVRVHLDTLQPYQEIESDGVLGKPATRRAIRLPRGKGVVGSPLIAIDGPATLDKETVLPEVATSAPASAANVGDPLCVGAGTCRVERTWMVPKCTSMKIVDTRSTMGPTEPDGGDECVGRSYWLVRGADASPVLLAEDCEIQIGAATTGTSTIEIKKCDVLFKYMETGYDGECLVREVGIRLDSLKVFKQTERNGVMRRNGCKTRTAKPRTIRLPQGKGVADSRLIDLDGRDLRDTRVVGPR